MATAEQFERSLDEKPDDWELRLVYADFLDDNDDPLFAACQRWMSENRKHTRTSDDDNGSIAWSWWKAPDYNSERIIDTIKMSLWIELESYFEIGAFRWHKAYHTRVDSERALCAALIKAGIIKEEIRA